MVSYNLKSFMVNVYISLINYYRKGIIMKSEQALKKFIFWTVSALVANICIFILWGKEYALQIFGGYVIELTLSVDNLFLFLMIFTTFGIPIAYQKRVLNYGIIGAMILRFLFISIGISMINKFHFLI